MRMKGIPMPIPTPMPVFTASGSPSPSVSVSVFGFVVDEGSGGSVPSALVVRVEPESPW